MGPIRSGISETPQDFSILDWPLFGVQKARSIGFALEGAALKLVTDFFPGRDRFLRRLSTEDLKLLEASLNSLLKLDSAHIRQGYYPVSVLKPESAREHVFRIPKLLWDAWKVIKRKNKGRTTVFSSDAKSFAEDLPRYYRRNFHYQTDGYLSEESAWLYEHQVELLFGGGGDAMRRLIIPPLKEKFGRSNDGKGLKFLEIAAGTGRTTRFMSLAFPKAQIVALDLSAPYLNFAKKRLERFPRVSFMQGDGAALPFKEGEFDAVYSVFLFHELPFEERTKVLKESLRVLKPGGFLGWVDSLQLGDVPELDAHLQIFPEHYHEPYYRNFIEHRLEKQLAPLLSDRVVSAANVTVGAARAVNAAHASNLTSAASPSTASAASEIHSRIGYFSKVCWVG